MPPLSKNRNSVFLFLGNSWGNSGSSRSRLNEWEWTAEVSIGPQSAYAKSQMEFVQGIAGSVRFIYPHQLFCFCVHMHQNLYQLQDIVGDLSEEHWMKSWRHVWTSEWWKDSFRTVINWFNFAQIFLNWGSLKGLQVKCSKPCVLLVFASILMNPWNNLGYFIKEMALAGRPEPSG